MKARTLFFIAVLMMLWGCAATPKEPARPTTASVALGIPSGDALASKLVAEAVRAQPALHAKATDVVALARDFAAAPAVEVLQDARFERDEAQRAYKQLAFKKALARLDRAQKVLSTAALDKESLALLADVALWRGLNLLALGRQDAATQAVRWALDLGHEPRPAKHAPEVEAFIEGVHKAPREVGTLTITTEPPGATVWVDGQRRDVAPNTLQLPTGLHLVRIESLGYRPRSLLQLVQAAKLDRVSFSLRQTDRPHLAAQIIALHASGAAALSSVKPEIWRRLFASDGLLIVEKLPKKIIARVSWLKGKGKLLCEGSRSLVVSCLASGLYRLATGRDPPKRRVKRRPLYRRWWFWAIIGSAVAGATGATIYAVTKESPSGTDVDIVTEP